MGQQTPQWFPPWTANLIDISRSWNLCQSPFSRAADKWLRSSASNPSRTSDTNVLVDTIVQ
jgi:hypothetical protein